MARRYRLPDPRAEPTAFVDRLAAILAGDEHAVLVPGAEASLLLVSEQRERLEPFVRIGLPPHEVVLRALDKLAVLDAARRAGLDPPESVACATEQEALAAAERLGYPVLLKPARSLLGSRQRPSRLVGDPEVLRRELPAFGVPATVQRRERGPVVSFGGVALPGGRLLGLCVSRYHRTWPPQGGAASFTETVEPPAEAVGRLETLLRDVGWHGLFELEALETAEGRLAAIDFNPRPYGSMILAVAAGANLPALWADHLLGRRPAERLAQAGVRYRWEEAELRNALWQARRGRVLEAAAVLRPHRRTAHAFVAARDPLPVLARPFRLIARARAAATSR